jgi:hypothetical protein
MNQRIVTVCFFISLLLTMMALAGCNATGGEPAAESTAVTLPTVAPSPTTAPQATETTMATAAPEMAEASLGTAFTLGGGQEIVVAEAGLTLNFTAVPEDSRCPKDVLCTWAGRALVEMEATLDGQAPVMLQFDTNLNNPVDILAVGDYTVQLLQLDPYPKTTDPIPFAEYRANLIVTK